MRLHALLRCLNPCIDLSALPDVPVSGVSEDSRTVRPGDLFVARPGTRTDGGRYIADAAASGAVAVVAGRAIEGSPLPVAVVPRPGEAASVLANLLSGEPARGLKVLGVTGTNGKTTTTYLVRHLLRRRGLACGLIGTVQIDDGRGARIAEMTTPPAAEIATLLATMRDNGCAACAIEASSHALDQGRVAGVRFAGAAFTNLSGDHLDYHGTMENYAAAKARLFESLDESAVAAVNVDDPWHRTMVRACRGRIVGWGFGESADYQAMAVETDAEGAGFILRTPAGQTPVRMRLVGRHNIANALAAAALTAETFGFSPVQIAEGLSDAPGAPGRLQRVEIPRPFSVLVDYAHTDDALRNVLKALRPLTRGKLRVVFGCGGDRDKTKRPRMARVASELADALYITSDNPRTENPEAIINDIRSGLDVDEASAAPRVVVEIDRRLAIRRAIGDAAEGDVVLLAGKGHENYQIVGAEKRHFDDVEEAMLAATEST